jgi:hypothetical protein
MDHMRDKYARDIKLDHNFMNITVYRARHKELVTPLGS